MPVQEGDRVTAIDVTTGLETVVTIPPTDPNVRPIILDEEIGLVTLARLSELAEDGFLEPTSFFETTYFYAMGGVPYINILYEGETITYEYVPTTQFNPEEDYQVISSAGSGIADMTGDEERQRRGGVGGRGGGGGSGGSGQQQGQGQGSDEPPIEPFPPIQEEELEHTCSDEEPPEPSDPPEEPSEPPEPKPPCPACAAGIPKNGKGKGQGQQQGSPSGSGQNVGPEMGEGQGEGSGEGQGSGSGEGQGEGSGQGQGEGSGSGSGEGSGSGSGEGTGEGSGEGQGEGSGQGQGEGSGEGQGEPSDSGQPIPNGTGQASGGTPSNGGGPPSPPGPPGPPNGEENDLLEQLLREQELRDNEAQEQEEMEEDDLNPQDFMDDTDESSPDNYDDIFDESPDIIDSDESPDEFMDVVPTDANSQEDRPFQDLSDEELQRMIDELMRQEPTPGPRPSQDSPSDTGQNPRQQQTQFPQTPVSPDLNLPQGQTWLWINTVSGLLETAVERPPNGPWVHVLFMTNPDGTNSTFIMTFDDLRRMDLMDLDAPMQIEYFQPVPTTLVMDFEEMDEFNLYINSPNFTGYQDGYWEVITDSSMSSITIQLMSNMDTDGPEGRWVSMGGGEDVSSDTTQAINQQMQEMIDQINQENQIATDRGIPTGYGEGSTSPYVPDDESNAVAQQEAAEAGARAGKGDASEAREGASRETSAARQEAQGAARQVEATDDIESAIEGVEQAIENAMKANAVADPTIEADVSNRNQAITAANDAINSLEEMLVPDAPMEDEIREMLNQAREDLDNLEIGEGSSLAQSMAEVAQESRDKAMDASPNRTQESLYEATNATEAAVDANAAAIQGDNDDRAAVQEARNMAQQAIDAANEAGADTSPIQQLLDQQPDINNLGELAEEAEARNRDTLPGEFADVNNPEVSEDMMVVARRATEIAEQAMAEANPTNINDMEAARYIQGQANNAIDNVEGRWDGDSEEINELRQKIQEAAAELDERAESMCALWNTTSQTWYRDMSGKILIFGNIQDALVYGVQKGIIPEDASPDMPSDWRAITVIPIGTGGEL